MKNISQIKGISQLKSGNTIRPRSIPKKQRSIQTELYMLRKEKERFLKEAERLEKRHGVVRDRLAQIDRDMNEMLSHWQKEMDTIKEEANVKVTGGVSAAETTQVRWKRRELKY